MRSTFTLARVTSGRRSWPQERLLLKRSIKCTCTWVRSSSPSRLRVGLGVGRVGWARWNTVSLKFDSSAWPMVYLVGQKQYFFPFRFWLNNIFYTNHWYIFSLTKSGQMFSVTFTISCTVSAQMYMCSWRFSWRAVNPQWARRTEMGRGNRVQGALGRGIVGTLLLVALPTIRYFLPTILERNR